MINRFLFDLISEGLTAFAANPFFFDVVFGQYLNLGAKEVEAIRATFAKKPIRVQLGYPHANITFPCICIVTQAESQSDKYLGDAGYLPTMGSVLGDIGCGSNWQTSTLILCYTENYDLTTYVYEVVKGIIVTSHLAIAKAGIHQPSLTGQDVQPDPRYGPENLFVRSLGFSAYSTYVLPEIFGQTLANAVSSGLSLPPGTVRVTAPYVSGVTIAAQYTSGE